MADRSLVPALLALVVPSDYGSERFALLTAGDWHPGGGTTCAYLGAFVLWGLGCRDSRIVNRTDPASGLAYRVAEGVSRLVNGAKAIGAWRPGAEGVRAGDVLFMSNGPPLSEHIALLAHGDPSTSTWTTADAGQRNAQGQQAARYVTRTWDGARLSSPAGPKTVQGYICIDAVPVDAPPLVDTSFGWGALLAAGLVFGALWKGLS